MYTSKGTQIRLCSGLNYVMMRTDVEGSDEVSCYRDSVYPSSEDTVRRNLYVPTLYSAVISCSLLDKIMKAGTSESKTGCSRSLINEHIIICLARVIAHTVSR